MGGLIKIGEVYGYFLAADHRSGVGQHVYPCSIGYTMVYGIIGLINFAHGEVFDDRYPDQLLIIGLMKDAMPGIPSWLIFFVADHCVSWLR
jgi:hypothetical protein